MISSWLVDFFRLPFLKDCPKYLLTICLVLVIAAGQAIAESPVYHDIHGDNLYYNSCSSSSSSSTTTTSGAQTGGGVSFTSSQSRETGGTTAIDDDGIDPSPTSSGKQTHSNSTSYAPGKLGWKVYYFVLDTGWASANHIVLGDVGTLTYRGTTVYAVYGDNHTSYNYIYSEISLGAAMAISGDNNVQKADVTSLNDVTTTIYPNTHQQLNGSVDQNLINQIGAAASGGSPPSSSTSGTGCCPTSGGSTSTGTSSTTSGSGAFTLDQEKTFLSESVTSTWNISNSTVEQWFLKQAGAQPVIGRYGLNSGNIGQITSAVIAAKVSPVFFYLDTVNEGGGAGGFINHYGSDAAGGGPGNATRDAQYIASQSQDKSAGPATGGGEPADMPTAEVQQILSALPSGSIGVYYIQATSAVTAELEDLSGHTGDWSGLFGHPVSDMMQNIKAMGGDPMQGGSTISTGGGCTTTGGGVASCGGSSKYSALVSSGASFAGVDQGIDFVPSGSSGFKICAPAPGTITLADQTGHHFLRTTGQAEIIEKLDQPPNAPSSSQYIYYAEIIQISNNISVNTHVNAGDVIGTNSQSPGIEVGWGLSPTEGFMCPIGYPTPCGTSFDSWIQGISAGKGP